MRKYFVSKKLISCARRLISYIENEEVANQLLNKLEGVETREDMRTNSEHYYEIITWRMITEHNAAFATMPFLHLKLKTNFVPGNYRSVYDTPPYYHLRLTFSGTGKCIAAIDFRVHDGDLPRPDMAFEQLFIKICVHGFIGLMKHNYVRDRDHPMFAPDHMELEMIKHLQRQEYGHTMNYPQDLHFQREDEPIREQVVPYNQLRHERNLQTMQMARERPFYDASEIQ